MPLPHELPGPNADVWDWQLRAHCRGEDSSLFFCDGDLRANPRIRREMRAKEICQRCPVLRECREYALSVGEPYGVWGGLSASERAALRCRQTLGSG